MKEHTQTRSTTVIAVRRGESLAMASDGQVTHGHTVLKAGARKVRRIYQDRVLVGFAGSTADAFALLERFQGKLEEYHGNLRRACVELAKDWRTDRALRPLEAFLITADREETFLLTGTGDVVEPDDGVCAVGSGGPLALAAARAVHTEFGAADIAREAMRIAAQICIYTNENIIVEEL